MKNMIFLLVFLLCALATAAQDLSTTSLLWKPAGGGGSFSSNPILNCGPPTKVDFKVKYEYSGSCKNTFNTDKYRITISLYNPNVSNAAIATYFHQWPGCDSEKVFPDISVYPNSYFATIVLQERKNLSWHDVDNPTTNFIYVSNTPAIPNFTIRQNNISYPPTSPITVHIKDTIYLDAAATTCENVYWIGVAERGYPSWTRTYDYEWGRWFGGEAPDGLNLQLLSVTYSVPPYYLNGNSNRHGTPLFGEPLPSGEERWYDVAVCTGEPAPSFNCKNAQLRVEDP